MTNNLPGYDDWKTSVPNDSDSERIYNECDRKDINEIREDLIDLDIIDEDLHYQEDYLRDMWTDHMIWNEEELEPDLEKDM